MIQGAVTADGGAINLNQERLLGLAIGEGAETFLGRAVNNVTVAIIAHVNVQAVCTKVWKYMYHINVQK